MKKSLASIAIVAVLLTTSCYHARVETGLQPSSKVVDKPFASSWIYGLVPPNTIKAAMECTEGVAVVETKLSFLNQLVGAITWGIYTPMHITITCASGSGMAAAPAADEQMLVENTATEQEKVAAFEQAVKTSAEKNKPIYVYFQ